uniref:Tectonic family member 2 n=1 Tax=Labrus bergylta TaxID=56723 RepID=A0A3Q3LZ55_9LABR
TAVQIELRLDRSLSLCGENDTETDCCPTPLCVLETLQVSACVGSKPQASLLIQARIHALLLPADAASNNTVIPNQVYQPLGSCPCDLTFRACDVRCCCDKECSSEDLELFASHCLPGPFGGQMITDPDYQCSVQSSDNSPDWFPFLCVNSPPENNPYLGLFYLGDTPSEPAPSFQMPPMSAPVPVIEYIQGSPIFTMTEQFFTIPRMVLGRCVNNAPVAFLNNFAVECVTPLQSCPTGAPLQTLPEDLRIQVKNGQGSGMECDLSPGLQILLERKRITDITLTHTVGTITLNRSTLTTRYSAEFLNGYQVGRPVIAGVVDLLENTTGSIQRMSISLWKPSDGLCSTAEKKPVLFGENSTSGCLLPVSRQNLTECDLLSHQHVQVWSLITGMVDGTPQRDILDLQVLSSWTLDCGGGDISPCVDPLKTQLFPITSSVTFIDIPINTGPPKTRFQINFTEYDCNRNDVCWPELAFPITKFYTEPYSQSLAKGLILVFFFITASILGTPWRQLRQ